ncbi:PD-(D/E)XK nuclease family protein, partial [Salmonella sp. SAL4360]|uniref:PD-(D/E)XK nuclease family protein n=1 Tax=Salmonella sp. SAL4360 TaxID=3159881 RepID=UPI00397CCE4F
ATATAFLDRLLEVGDVPKPSSYRSVRVHRQFQDIDVLLLVNDDIAVIVEDKINTKDHSGQLPRYNEAVRSGYPNHRIAA